MSLRNDSSASIWAIRSNIFLEQLDSPSEIFIRLVWAPLLFVGAVYSQAMLIHEYQVWSMMFLFVTLPIASWGFTGVFMINDVRQKFTELIFSGVPEVLFSSVDFIVMLAQGLFHLIGFVIRIIVHLFI